MRYRWGCGHSFEWAEAEAHYWSGLAACGEKYWHLTLDEWGVNDPAPCLDCMVFSPRVRLAVADVMGPECGEHDN